jgi:hypothetical protein
MTGIKFRFWHSLLGLSILVSAEGLLIQVVSATTALWIICIASLIGTIAIMYVATEVIEDIRASRRMLVFLSAVVAEFLIFFSFQYWYLIFVQPSSFPSLSPDSLSLLLHSTMVFVFNPLNTPQTTAGQALLLINILGALVLAMFIFQNISQLRRKDSAI